jgi:thiol:disulfide interchange protein DsbD
MTPALVLVMKQLLNMDFPRILALLMLVASPILPAAELPGSGGDVWLQEEDDFLPVDEAFRLQAQVSPEGDVIARWDMPDGYYLYRHRFEFETRSSADRADSPVALGPAEIPDGKKKIDDYFGEVEVYYHSAEIVVPVASGAGQVEVGIGFQGCADAGLCYPPETKWFPLTLAATPGNSDDNGGSGLAATLPAGESQPAGAAMTAVPQTEEQALAGMLTDGALLTSLALFFLGGIALAFTPCVLPMVPILSSIIVGESASITRGRAFSLSLAYVLGMAITYALVGVLVGLFGASLNLQAALQSPTVLVTFAIVFVALSFSMFGFYELQLPQSWQNGLNALGDKVGGGKHLSVLVMGSLSSLVVSPCVSAPLAGALIYISSTGDAVLGGGALLALGLGMGIPLLVIGSSGGHLLPRAGAWMNTVKAVFGVLLLGVAVWLLERVVAPSVTLGLWAMLAIGAGVYLGAMDFSPRQGWGQLWKASGAISFIYGVLLLVGAASGAEDPLRPLKGFGVATITAGSPSAGTGAQSHGEARWYAVRSLDELNRQLADAGAAGQPVLLDLYADWCISCKVMEREVFPQPEVASRLAQFRLLRADVTENNAQDKALLEAFGLFGPPSLVFFAEDGRELSEVRIQGEIGADALANHLGAVLGQFGSTNVGEIVANFGQK